MTKCITYHTTNRPLSSALHWKLQSSLWSALPWPVKHTRLFMKNSPTNPTENPAVLSPAQRSQEPVLASRSYATGEALSLLRKASKNINFILFMNITKSEVFLPGTLKKRKKTTHLDCIHASFQACGRGEGDKWYTSIVTHPGHPADMVYTFCLHYHVRLGRPVMPRNMKLPPKAARSNEVNKRNINTKKVLPSQQIRN